MPRKKISVRTGQKAPRSGRYTPDNGGKPIYLSEGERIPPARKKAATYVWSK